MHARLHSWPTLEVPDTWFDMIWWWWYDDIWSSVRKLIIQAIRTTFNFVMIVRLDFWLMDGRFSYFRPVIVEVPIWVIITDFWDHTNFLAIFVYMAMSSERAGFGNPFKLALVYTLIFTSHQGIHTLRGLAVILPRNIENTKHEKSWNITSCGLYWIKTSDKRSQIAA